MDCPETRARLSKARSFWIAFRRFRKKNHSTARPMTATNASPPTTPPAIAPALDCDLPVDAGVLDGTDEVERLVLIDVVDEDIETGLGVLVASDE